MFERFTAGARQAVVLAQQEARTLGHGYLGTEHLLLGVLVEGRGLGARLLAERGVEAEVVRAWLRRALSDGPLTRPDPQALATIGIDLDAVRRKVEEAFGPGALDRARSVGSECVRGLWRRRRSQGGGRGVSGHLPFTPRAKKALELSLREAMALGDAFIASEHVLLGLLREGEGMAARLLAEYGVELKAVRSRIRDERGRAAGA